MLPPNTSDTTSPTKNTATQRPNRNRKSKRALSAAQKLRQRNRRQQRGQTLSVFDRLLYAVVTGLMFGLAGALIDLLVTLLRSLAGAGGGETFWLFAPILGVLGMLIGAISGNLAGADSMDMIGSDENAHLDEVSIKHDIFRGLGFGILLFALIWIVLLIMA